MSGSPTEAEVQTQWKAAVNLLEKSRNYADGTVAGAGGLLDTLIQALEGDYTPGGLTVFAARVRQGLSDIVSPQMARAALEPVIFEYAKILGAASAGGFGSGYRSSDELARAIYEWLDANSATIPSRTITYDTSATAGGSNVGNGAMSRLTVDENGYNLEACHVEKKAFRCRADANSGASKHAEVFEFVGIESSPDSLLRGTFGSGEAGRVTITSKHAGSGQGGSLLNNSSFSSYNASSSPKFSSWTETAGGSSVSQDTTNYYRSFPGATTDASLKITGGAGTVTLTQLLSDTRVQRLDPNRPYFLRVMVNKSTGSGLGGNFVVKLGSVTVTTAVSGLSSGWNEVIVPIGTSCWFANFNQAALSVVIEWSSSTSGYLLVDDVLFCPWDLIDGTYWCLRGNAASPTAWLLNDTLEFTDTGGAAGTGKLQWWWWVAGFGYLPSGGSPTIADPT